MVVVRKSFIKMLIWLLIGFGSFFLIDSTNIANSLYQKPIIYLGFLIVVHGLIYFNVHGQNYITSGGLFLLYSTLLHGFASIYLALTRTLLMEFGHFVAVLILFISQIVIYFLFLADQRFVTSNIAPTTDPDFKMDGYLIYFLVFGLVFSNLASILSPFREATVYTSIIILLIRIFIISDKQYVYSKLLLIALLLFYFLNIFAGFGRINVVTLVISILLVLSIKINASWIKRGITILYFPSIIIGSLLRGGSEEDLLGGVGSMISPLLRFGDLIELYMNKEINLAFGKTIYAAFAVFVPRFLWENKPWNFNREITYIFAPEYINAGHSEAGVFMAEIVFNFGFTGIFISIFLIGWLLKRLDQRLFSYPIKNELKFKDLNIMVACIITSTGLLNLMWGGFSTFVNRDGFRLVILVIANLFYSLFFVRIINYFSKNRNTSLL